MSDFAGDFILQSDQLAPSSPTPSNAPKPVPRSVMDEFTSMPDPDPRASQMDAERDAEIQALLKILKHEEPEPTRPWRVPVIEAMNNLENPARNPVVNRCVAAAARAFAEGYNSGQTKYFSLLMAQAAFSAAMPDPVTEEDTRSFVACVAYGIHSRMIYPDEAPRLLYAAQIALTGTASKRKS